MGAARLGEGSSRGAERTGATRAGGVGASQRVRPAQDELAPRPWWRSDGGVGRGAVGLVEASSRGAERASGARARLGLGSERRAAGEQCAG